MMKYKGYIGVIKIDTDAGVLRGHVTNTRDTITFQGKSVPEAIAEFRVSVDEYLDFCKSLGQARRNRSRASSLFGSTLMFIVT